MAFCFVSHTSLFLISLHQPGAAGWWGFFYPLHAASHLTQPTSLSYLESSSSSYCHLPTHSDHVSQPNSHFGMGTEVDVDNKKRDIIGQILVFGTLALCFGAIYGSGTARNTVSLGLFSLFACISVVNIGRLIIGDHKKNSKADTNVQLAKSENEVINTPQVSPSSDFKVSDKVALQKFSLDNETLREEKENEYLAPKNGKGKG